MPAAEILLNLEHYEFQSVWTPIIRLSLFLTFSFPPTGINPFKIILRESEIGEGCKNRTIIISLVEPFKNSDASCFEKELCIYVEYHLKKNSHVGPVLYKKGAWAKG